MRLRIKRKPRVAVVLFATILVFVSGWNAAPVVAQQLPAAPLAPPSVPEPPTKLSFGAILATNSPSWARVLPATDTRGALVLAVLPGSPAERAGVTPGDVIVAIDDNEVQNYDRARFLLRSRSDPNLSVSLAGPVGRPRTVAAQLAEPGETTEEYAARRLRAGPDPVAQYLLARQAPRPEALRRAEDLVSTLPDFGEAHALRGRALLFGGDGAPPRSTGIGPEVGQALERAVQLDPRSSSVLSLVAEVHVLQKSYSEAESLAGRAVELDPGSARAHYLLGSARYLQARPELALPDLRRAVELDPYVVGQYERLALAYDAVGQRDSGGATRQVLASMVATPEQARDEGWSTALKVAVPLAVLSSLCGIVLPLVGRSRRQLAPEDDRNRADDEHRVPATPRSIELYGPLELVAAVGLWAVVIPFLGPAFGLVPRSRQGLEVVEHFVPGAMILVASAVSLVLLIKNGAPGLFARSAIFVIFLGGLWITTTHVSLVPDAISGTRSWGLAIFLSTTGPVVIVLVTVLYRRMAWWKARSRSVNA